MYHIAIVEDEAEFSAQLQEYLKQYQKQGIFSFSIHFKPRFFGIKYILINNMVLYISFIFCFKSHISSSLGYFIHSPVTETMNLL